MISGLHLAKRGMADVITDSVQGQILSTFICWMPAPCQFSLIRYPANIADCASSAIAVDNHLCNYSLTLGGSWEQYLGLER